MRKLVLALLVASLSHAAETYVVAAGVEKYDDSGISTLAYAATDANTFAEALQAAGVPAGNIKLYTSDATDFRGRPTRSNLLRALQWGREMCRPGDTLIFLFSGHGIQQGDEAYLLTIDSNRALPAETALPARLIPKALDGFQGAHLLLIVDACRNNPAAGKGEENAALDERFAKAMRPRLDPAASSLPEPAVLLACAAGERAWEMPEQGSGALVYWLLRGLTGEAGETDGGVKLSDLAAYVEREVPAWARRAKQAQHPTFANPGADFTLPKVPRATAPAAPMPGQPAQPTGPQVDIVRREGTLEITTTLPVVSVEVNGQPAGQVRAGQPLRQKRLIGRVTVRGAAAGHVPLEQTVEVALNQTATVKLDLLKLPGLKIESELPGVTVEVDGVARGQAGPGAPVTVEELTVGEHRVRVSVAGRAPAEQTVTLAGGRTESIRLTPLPFPTLTIEVEEEGVTVLLDGQPLGELSPATPAVVRNVLPGEHKITARKGGEERVETVSLAAGKDHTLTAWFLLPLPEYLARWKDKMPKNLRFRIAPKDGMPQVLIPAGEFLMGSPANEQGRQDDEGPQKRVYVSAFWMDLHEVTVGQYQRFCAETRRQMPPPSSYGWEDRHPVSKVTWDDAAAYCEWAGRRLPTEAEWEKAARGGREGQPYVWGNQWPPPRGAGNFADLTAKKKETGWSIIDGYDDGYAGVSPVGSFAPNGYGVFDLAGNVWEWCQDWYDAGWYAQMPGRDPCNTTKGSARVLRGGSFYLDGARFFRVASRFWYVPGFGFDFGFRGVAGAALGS